MSQKAKVLYVESDLLIRESLTAYLEDLGHEVLSASDGKEALDLFVLKRADILITDLDLPTLSGLDLMKDIREMAPSIPIIIVSGVVNTRNLIQTLRYRIADFYIKPVIDFKVIEESIEKAIEHFRFKDENEKIRHTLLEDQEAGRSVQEKILPPTPFEKDLMKVEHQVVPMLYLSGDFVDYIQVSDNFFVFYLADVSGHGAAAAFVTVLIKMYVREQAAKYRSDNDKHVLTPHLLLKELAHVIYSAKLGKYCTMLYFVYDKNLEEIHYSVAGHYPNPVIVQNGKARYLEGRGFPVGISQSMTYKSQVIELQPPYTIILFSDGIFEIMPGEIEQKEKELLGIVENTDLSMSSINAALKITTTPDRLDDVSVLVFSKREE